MNKKENYVVYETPRAIEQLHFTVNPNTVEKFIELDYEIWTKMLSKQEGFVRKELWVSKNNTCEIFTITYWRDIKYWKKIDKKILEENGKKFASLLGEDNFKFNAPLHEGNQKYQVDEYRLRD